MLRIAIKSIMLSDVMPSVNTPSVTFKLLCQMSLYQVSL
jgi:hypothetical protein